MDSFRGIFQEQPVKDGVYSLTYWNVTVLDVAGENVTILNDARNMTFQIQQGTAELKVSNDSVILLIDPVPDSTVMTLEGGGRVVHVGNEDYTVDLNHPLAGESLLIFVRVEGIIKQGATDAGSVVMGELELLNSFENAKILAADSGLPILLYFHSASCPWCRRFEKDVLGDEGVAKMLGAGFVNVAIDVDSERSLAREFKIVGTPTIIFLGSDGSEIKRIRGYQDAQTFKETLASLER
jgi:thiol-disulfide isomerase/thioredoxin